VYDAVANFNIGRKASVLIFEKMNMTAGTHMINGCRELNNKKGKTFFVQKQEVYQNTAQDFAWFEKTKGRQGHRKGGNYV